MLSFESLFRFGRGEYFREKCYINGVSWFLMTFFPKPNMGGGSILFLMGEYPYLCGSSWEKNPKIATYLQLHFDLSFFSMPLMCFIP